MRVVWRVAVVVAALAAALWPVPPALVEGWYSTWFYTLVQRGVTGVSNLVPFALFDVLLLGSGIWAVVRLASGAGRAWRARRAAPLFDAVAVVAVFVAAVYLLFVGLWGLNYRRVPMQARVDTRAEAPTPAEALTLARRAVAALNATYEMAHADGGASDPWRDESLTRASVEVQRLLSDGVPASAGRLKRTLLGTYFRWTGVDGMVNPFALEVLANPDLLPVERPFVAAHEWAHLAGYAVESEASFVGFLTCMRAGAAGRYSGWLFLYWQLASEVTADERQELWASLGSGPKSDIEAITARIQRGQLPTLRRVSWGVYDQYLKANRVENGVRSYSQVVSLLLQTRFDEGWVPRRRQD